MIRHFLHWFIAIFCHRGPSLLLGDAAPICARCAGFYPALAGMVLAALWMRRPPVSLARCLIVSAALLAPMVVEGAFAYMGSVASPDLLLFWFGALAGVGVAIAGWAILAVRSTRTEPNVNLTLTSFTDCSRSRLDFGSSGVRNLAARTLGEFGHDLARKGNSCRANLAAVLPVCLLPACACGLALACAPVGRLLVAAGALAFVGMCNAVLLAAIVPALRARRMAAAVSFLALTQIVFLACFDRWLTG